MITNYNYDPDFCARYGIPQTSPPFIVFFLLLPALMPFLLIIQAKLSNAQCPSLATTFDAMPASSSLILTFLSPNPARSRSASQFLQRLFQLSSGSNSSSQSSKSRRKDILDRSILVHLHRILGTLRHAGATQVERCCTFFL